MDTQEKTIISQAQQLAAYQQQVAQMEAYQDQLSQYRQIMTELTARLNQLEKENPPSYTLND